MDVEGAVLGDAPCAFDHGIRRSPAEGRDFEGAAVRRSPAEELASKGYFLHYAKRRCEGEELRCGAYRYRLREDGTARLVSYEGSAEQVDVYKRQALFCTTPRTARSRRSKATR